MAQSRGVHGDPPALTAGAWGRRQPRLPAPRSRRLPRPGLRQRVSKFKFRFKRNETLLGSPQPALIYM